MTSRKGSRSPAVPAAANPVALVRIDTPVPHLDRVFDYLVPAGLDEQAQPGVRVRVRFGGRLMDGFIVERREQPTAEVALKPIERVVSPRRVLLPEVLALCEAVADRNAGSVSDVLRAAVPPRHAGAERAAPAQAAGAHKERPAGAHKERPAGAHKERPEDAPAWAAYAGGESLLARLRAGEPVRAAWSLAPASNWVDQAAALVRAASARGVIAVVPDAADVQALAAALGPACTTLTADMGPERRYRSFLAALDGTARIVVGTRSAVFAPVADLGLILVWDDGDDSLREPHAPYWHARDVAAMRAHALGCALVVGSPARSIEMQQLVRSGWAKSVAASRSAARAAAPAVRPVDPEDVDRDHPGRMPRIAWSTIKRALADGPVLVQVPRAGYVPALACARCRQPAVCSCSGPLAQEHGGPAACRWCGRLAADWVCACGGRTLRAAAVGVERTAEEIGRAFPGTSLIWSHAPMVRRSVPAAPALVVATPGAEPRADGGYAAVILLDAAMQLARASLDAGEQALRRWFAAAALARPRAPLVVAAPSQAPPVQALARWDAPWWADRELDERERAGLPPAVRFISLAGPDADILAVAAELEDVRQLGPVDGRLILSLPRDAGAQALRTIRSRAQRAKVAVRCDPDDL